MNPTVQNNQANISSPPIEIIDKDADLENHRQNIKEQLIEAGAGNNQVVPNHEEHKHAHLTITNNQELLEKVFQVNGESNASTIGDADTDFNTQRDASVPNIESDIESPIGLVSRTAEWLKETLSRRRFRMASSKKFAQKAQQHAALLGQKIQEEKAPGIPQPEQKTADLENHPNAEPTEPQPQTSSDTYLLENQQEVSPVLAQQKAA